MATEPQRESQIQNAEMRYQERISKLGAIRGTKRPARLQNSTFDPATLARIESMEAVAAEESARRVQNLSPQNIKKPKRLVRLGRFSAWVGVSVAFTSYMLQFVFGIASLVFFLGAALVDSNFVGKMLSKLSSFVSDFTLQGGGFGLWAVASIIALLTFLGFLLWFRLIGINVFKTPISQLVTYGALAVSILPIGNLFPCILLWVVYINITNLFSSGD